MNSIKDFNRERRRQIQKKVDRENKLRPESLSPIHKDNYPKNQKIPDNLIIAYHSKKYLVQVYKEGEGIHRVSVCSTKLQPDMNYFDGLTWDELQKIKSDIGFGDKFACEVYPEDKDVVNVANMRHLWVFDEPLGFGWRKNNGK